MMTAALGFAEISAYYDEMYVNENHYKEEVDRIVELVNRYNPTTKTILDIACGTGAQAKYLAEHYAVTGVDLSPEMVEIAKTKVPSGEFLVADMCDFSLDVCFDTALSPCPLPPSWPCAVPRTAVLSMLSRISPRKRIASCGRTTTIPPSRMRTVRLPWPAAAIPTTCPLMKNLPTRKKSGRKPVYGIDHI